MKSFTKELWFNTKKPRSLWDFVDFLHIYAKNPDYRAPYAVCKV
jgi:hypothetical protein